MRIRGIWVGSALVGGALLVAGCAGSAPDAEDQGAGSAVTSSAASADLRVPTAVAEPVVVDTAPAQFRIEDDLYQFTFRDANVGGRCSIYPAAPGSAVSEVGCSLPFADGAAQFQDPETLFTGPPNSVLLAPSGNRLAINEGGPPGRAEPLELAVGERLTVGDATCTRLGLVDVECAAATGDFRFEDRTLSMDGRRVDLSAQPGPVAASEVPVGPGVNCGRLTPADGNRNYVKVLSGEVSCARALAMIAEYDGQPVSADGGNAQIRDVGAGYCSTATAGLASEQGYATSCHLGDTHFARMG